MAKRSKLQRLHDRRRANVDKEILLLSRLIERDELLADCFDFLVTVVLDDPTDQVRRNVLLERMRAMHATHL